MDPYRFSPLGEPDPTNGKHVFFISAVRQTSAEWGFEITDRDEEMPVQKMRYADRATAEEAHAKLVETFRGMAAGTDGATYAFKAP